MKVEFSHFALLIIKKTSLPYFTNLDGISILCVDSKHVLMEDEETEVWATLKNGMDEGGKEEASWKQRWETYSRAFGMGETI